MTYAHTSHAAHSGIVDRLNAAVTSLKDAFARRRVYNQVYRELDELSARDLADLGIHRSMINQIAMEAAYAR